ncbi:DUF1534 domain-containing protein [Pseudomonas syringae pv. maculicola str. ES4326]|uniref:DUF1534 domain-containing protein n=1 Tax=Pseudomonas syringae pv. maculicola str. ES4326 TaxID=629265 RepID=A0A8T8BWU9_PSEYM|nr:DUF1534 domain-containing protein [Pseudomonas syringae pv. maculicola str. ES4326]
MSDDTQSGRGASRTACDAERRTIVELSFRTLQRGNALLDAPRHTICVSEQVDGR